MVRAGSMGYSAEALAEQKRERELMIQSRKFLETDASQLNEIDLHGARG